MLPEAFLEIIAGRPTLVPKKLSRSHNFIRIIIKLTGVIDFESKKVIDQLYDVLEYSAVKLAPDMNTDTNIYR